MTDNKTLGHLKKRIFDALDEYSENNGVFVTDTNREILISRMPDAVTSSLVRMYESLAVGRGRCTSRLYRPRLIFESFSVENDGISVDFDTASLGMSFGFYGSGSLVIENEDGESVFSKTCEGDGVKMFERELVTLPGTGSYTIMPTGDLKIVGIAVYENDGFADANAIPMRGELSFQVPSDFDGFISIEGSEKYALRAAVHEPGMYAGIHDCLFKEKNELCFEYRKSVPVITDQTSDDFAFDISPLAFEALVCLAAAELCREEESGMYTRLLYKYSDLSEGLYKSKYADIYKRNGFFKAVRKMR